MLYSVLKRIDSLFPIKEARAHCDIPCGISDPIPAQIAALTVIRMVDLATELEKEHPNNLESQNSLARYILVKEEHAEKCKHEIRVIYGDYFKPEHLQKYPELSTLLTDILHHASKAKQSMKRDEGLQLLKSVNRFAEIFWETKDVSTKSAKSPYEPKEKVSYPVF
jgi:nickel superoxide dismutase